MVVLSSDVSGLLTALDANLNILSRNGDTILQNTTANGSNNFYGGLQTKGEQFKKTISIFSYNVTQELHLKGNTLINVDVTFKQSYGIVTYPTILRYQVR
ncbi:MAG: hypothetical protein KAH18_10605 [Psychromonas sp.]|nr:hypothetical protein [Psychromonas sp.]